MAGVASPQGAATLLKEYVEQGGNLIVAAGGQFDPAAWNEAAWCDGLGILPAPLRAATVGHRRDEPGDAQPFLLDFESLVHEYFKPEGSSEEELRALFGPPDHVLQDGGRGGRTKELPGRSPARWPST